LLERDAHDSNGHHDFGQDIIPALVSGRASALSGARAHVHAHNFADSCVNMVGTQPYWRDVGTLDSYWEANMDLTHVTPDLNLYDVAWPQPSRQLQRPPAKFVFDDDGRRGLAVDSLPAFGARCSFATCGWANAPSWTNASCCPMWSSVVTLGSGEPSLTSVVFFRTALPRALIPTPIEHDST